jgi:hypothetical protein
VFTEISLHDLQYILLRLITRVLTLPAGWGPSQHPSKGCRRLALPRILPKRDAFLSSASPTRWARIWRSSYRCCPLHIPRALPDHGVERVREEAARTAVDAADVLEVTGFFQVPFDEAQVALAVQLVPDGDCFGWKAAIREGDSDRGADSQDTSDLVQHGDRIGKLIYGDADAHPVKLRLLERKLRVTVEVLDHVLVEPRVLLQLHLVHTQAHYPPVSHLFG